MPDLLHEHWTEETGGRFTPVSEHSDRLHRQISPNERFLFEIWAPSWREAMRLYDEKAYGEFGKSYDHIPDDPYTEEDAAEQRAYLLRRSVRR